MKLWSTTRLSLLAAALVCAGGAQAQQTMTGQEYSAAMEQIKADYKTAKAACDKLAGNAKDICVEEAKGKEKVADAQLKYQRSGKPEDATKVALAKADATYEVAKERCDDLKGNDKDVCLKDAKAAETRARTDAKAAEKSAEAKQDAMEDKRNAEYKAAMERCDSLAGAAKSECVDTAKARFNKM
jgi:hypothetical protein